MTWRMSLGCSLSSRDHVGNNERVNSTFEGRLCWTIAWYWFDRTRHIRPIYEEAFIGDAGLRRRIEVDRGLQQFPAASLETEGGHGVFWHEDYKYTESGKASIAVIPSVHLWLAFWAAIGFRELLALVFSHLAIFRLQPHVKRNEQHLCSAGSSWSNSHYRFGNFSRPCCRHRWSGWCQ